VKIRLARAAAAGVALCLLTLGCGSDDGGPSRDASGTNPDPTVADAPDSTETSVELRGTIEVVQDDYSIEGLPAEIEVGTVLHVTNASATEMHELISIRLPQGEDRPADELLALPRDELAGLLGSAIPDVVRVSLPGSVELPDVGDALFEQPGRHLVFCAMPVGADPAVIAESDRYTTGRSPEQYENSPKHYERGEFADVVVR
jgi:hypothetical protein